MTLLNKLLGHEPMVYRGGGKRGGGATEVAKPMTTITSVGSALDAPEATFEEEKLNKVETKKMGTRGLRIPLENTPTTQANTGVQL